MAEKEIYPMEDKIAELNRELDAANAIIAEQKREDGIIESLRARIAALESSIEACHVAIDDEDRGPSRAVSTDGGVTWKPHTLQYRVELLLRVNKEACDAIERAEKAESALAEAQRDGERYRWLRDKGPLCGSGAANFHCQYAGSSLRLDREIDAALAKKGAEHG